MDKVIKFLDNIPVSGIQEMNKKIISTKLLELEKKEIEFIYSLIVLFYTRKNKLRIENSSIPFSGLCQDSGRGIKINIEEIPKELLFIIWNFLK